MLKNLKIINTEISLCGFAENISTKFFGCRTVPFLLNKQKPDQFLLLRNK